MNPWLNFHKLNIAAAIDMGAAALLAAEVIVYGHRVETGISIS